MRITVSTVIMHCGKEVCRRGLSELCSTTSSCRVTRPKHELLTQKSVCRPIFLTQPHRQPLLFYAKYPLSSKDSTSILLTIESNVLSKRSSC